MLADVYTNTEKRTVFKMVPTESIRPNPEGNPRKNIKQRDIDKLCTSIIACNGILVPLVAYPGEEEGTYFLLDGERRLIAAKKLGLKTVPVNILPKALGQAENLATMFTIHMARVPWNTMARAMALNQFLRIRPELEKDKKTLSQITGMGSYEINNAMLIRMFSQELQLRSVYSEKPNGIEPSYLIELAKVIQKAEQLGLSVSQNRSKVIDSFVNKIGRVIRDPYQLKDLGNILGNVQKKEAVTIFKGLVEDPERGITETVIAYANKVRGLRSLHVPKTESSTRDAISLAKTQWSGLLISLETLRDLKLSGKELKEIKRLLRQTQSAVKTLSSHEV